MMDELLWEYQNGNVEALKHLIDWFSKKMESLSYKYYARAKHVSLERTDLLQEGWIAFMDAAKKFEIREDSKDSCSFATYAWTAVEFAIRNVIRKNRPMGYKSCDPADSVLLHSLDAEFNNDDGTWTLYDQIPNEDAAIGFQEFENAEYNIALRNDLLQLLDSVFCGTIENIPGITNEYLLKKMQEQPYSKNILLLHYGLYGKAMTFDEISESTGYTASYIGDIESKAIWKLRSSVPGKQFMKLYGMDMIHDLMGERLSVSIFMKPDEVVNRIESLNAMLKNYY